MVIMNNEVKPNTFFSPFVTAGFSFINFVYTTIFIVVKVEKVFEYYGYIVLPLHAVAKFGTFYFLLKIKILAKRKREFTTKFALKRSEQSK